MSLQFLSRGLSRHVFAPTHQWMQNRVTTPLASSFAVRTFASKKVGYHKLVWEMFMPSMLSNCIASFAPNSLQHKNLLKHAKGFRGRAKNCYSIAIRGVHKSWQYAYRDRKRKKREWHKLWIQRIQAGVRQYSFRYSDFYGNYRKSGMEMDRKILSELAATEPFAFRSVVQVVEQQKLASASK